MKQRIKGDAEVDIQHVLYEIMFKHNNHTTLMENHKGHLKFQISAQLYAYILHTQIYIGGNYVDLKDHL